MSSHRRYDRDDHNARSSREGYRDYDRMYDDRPGDSRDYRRPTSPHAYDRSRTPPRDYRHSEYSSNRGRERFDQRRSPPHRGRRGEYQDRDQEGYRSPPRSYSRSRSRSRNRSRSSRRSRSPRFGGPPSKEVMLDNLPPDMTEEDVGPHLPISNELKRFYDIDELDGIRVIRDKQTKQSRGFGFLRFASLKGARDFLEQNYPVINLYGSLAENEDKQPTKVRVAYTRERDDRRQDRSESDWMCRMCSFVNFSGRRTCHKCHAPFTGETQQKPEFTNTGDSDASPDGTPSQFLLIRGLEPSVTEELLAKGVAKMYKPTGPVDATSKQGKKTAKVASTTGDANLGAKDGSLKRVMVVRDRRNEDSWRYGFAEFYSIEDAQAALTRFHSFERFTIASKPVDVSYIHAGVFVPVFDPSTVPEGVTFAASTNPNLQLQYWDENAYVSELSVNEPEQQAATVDENYKASADPAAAAEREGLVGSDEPGSRKRKGDVKDASKTKKTAPAHLQFWSNRHAELHGIPAKSADEAENSMEAQSPPTGSDATPQPPQQSYADHKRMCCLLCARQFKSNTEVNKHERLSKLHAENLQKPELCSKAIAKLAKAGITPASVVQADDGSSEYRDRAKERRRAFGSDKSTLPMKKQPAAQKPEASPDKAGVPSQSKGAALMGKMGWAAGQGLGAQGAGATELIPLDKYAAGVGLGAEGGKLGDAAEEAARNTRSDYAGFVERAKEKAKERFEKMV